MRRCFRHVGVEAAWHIRHRAWVGALRLRGRSLGSRGMPLEGFLETLGSRFGAFWGLFRAFGASWGLLGASWGVLEASWSGRLGFSVRGLHLGPLLGPSWGPLGPSWAPFGLSWGSLGRSWGYLGGLLGRLGVVLGASWAVLERRKGEKARKPKTFNNLTEINDFGFLGPSWEGSWGSLGTSWRPLGPS